MRPTTSQDKKISILFIALFTTAVIFGTLAAPVTFDHNTVHIEATGIAG